MKRIIFGVGRVIGATGRATIALVGICGVIAALANYTMTQGSGTNFGSIVVSTVHYAQGLLCDPVTPANCMFVTGSGAAKVDGSAVTQPISGTVTANAGSNTSTASLALSATQGATSDSPCTVPTSATACSEIAIAKAIANVANSATPAGENHIGEIASNQIKVQVAQTVTAASAYAAGNAVGGLQTIAGAARVSGSLGAAGTGGILTGLMMNSKSLQTTQVDVFLFDANPSGSTCTDKTAFSLATADFDKVIGVVTIPGTAANGAGWYAGTVGSTGVATYYPVTYDLASATSIFACAVTRGTPTYTATTDVSFKYNILRN